MQGQWMNINDYAEMTQMDRSAVEALIVRGKLTTTVEDGEVFIDAGQGMAGIVPVSLQELSASHADVTIGASFVEKTIGNEFLKEALATLQELYDEDRNIIATLTEQLRLSQQEVEFMRRKYKLMWGKVIDDHAS